MISRWSSGGRVRRGIFGGAERACGGEGVSRGGEAGAGDGDEGLRRAKETR